MRTKRVKVYLEEHMKKIGNEKRVSRWQAIEAYLVRKQDLFLSTALCYILSYQALLTHINYITNFFIFGEKGSPVDTLIIYALLALSFGVILLYLVRGRTKDTIYLFVFIVVAYTGTYIAFPANRPFMTGDIFDVRGNPLYNLFVFNFLSYAAIRCISDLNVFVRVFEKFSFIVILSAISHFVLPIPIVSREIYLVFSYNILLHTVFLVLLFIKEGDWLRFFVSLIGFAMIFFDGGRGALLISLLVPLLYFLYRGNASRRVKVITVFCLLIIFSTVLLSPILDKVSSLVGVGGRTIDLLLSGDFLETPRLGIYREMIENTRLLGKGLYADRLITEYKYAHNLLFEILVQFGWIIGLVIVAFIGYLLYRGIKSNDKTISLLFFTFLSTGLLKLMLTGSYLHQEPAFYVLLAISYGEYQAYHKCNRFLC